MQLLFKRNKIFMQGNDRYVGTIGTDGKAPLWIKQTDTFKMGVKDGSIIDLRAEAEAEEAAVEAAKAAPPEAPKPTEPPEPAGLKKGK